MRVKLAVVEVNAVTQHTYGFGFCRGKARQSKQPTTGDLFMSDVPIDVERRLSLPRPIVGNVDAVVGRNVVSAVASPNAYTRVIAHLDARAVNGDERGIHLRIALSVDRRKFASLGPGLRVRRLFGPDPGRGFCPLGLVFHRLRLGFELFGFCGSTAGSFM